MSDGMPATGGGWRRPIVAIVVARVVIGARHGGAKGRCPQ